jgi:hypothetical protein
MTQRSEEAWSSAEARNSDLDDLPLPGVESEEIEEASETEWEEGQPPSPDEIRLRAYYRYMERQDRDDDEIADWLAAESELRQRDNAGRQRRPKRLEDQAPGRSCEHNAGEHTWESSPGS